MKIWKRTKEDPVYRQHAVKILIAGDWEQANRVADDLGLTVYEWLLVTRSCHVRGNPEGTKFYVTWGANPELVKYAEVARFDIEYIA